MSRGFNSINPFYPTRLFLAPKLIILLINKCIFNAGSDKRLYYRAPLSVSSDTVSQFGDIFNNEQENWVT